MKPSHCCRVCGQPLFDQPLLTFANMPAAAQGFPDSKEVSQAGGVDLEIFQCSGCGLVQLAAEPVPYYREVIRAAGISPVLQEAKRRQFTNFIERYELQGKPVLEVGCGRGEFLSILQQLPVTAWGTEFSENSIQFCQDTGLRVFHGYPSEDLKDIPGAPFDAFFLLMFLEHMPDPNGALLALRNLLTSGAVGLIEVPNFDMMVKNRLFSEFIADHLFYFSKETLTSTLQLNGFEVIESEEIRDDYVISITVRRRDRLDLSDFIHSQDQIALQLRNFIARFPLGRVAIWGAGHQALAILSLSGISRSIRYVVDSAPFKQGKFTPATGLPVVPPDTLKLDPVDAVIVIAGGYTDEVAGIIARDYGSKISVAILRANGLEIPHLPEKQPLENSKESS